MGEIENFDEPEQIAPSPYCMEKVLCFLAKPGNGQQGVHPLPGCPNCLGPAVTGLPLFENIKVLVKAGIFLADPDLATAGKATLAIHDVAGRRVRTLVDEHLVMGRYERVWDGRDAAGRGVSSGVYFCVLDSGDHVEARKMVMFK